jgi:hypothetical protein
LSGTVTFAGKPVPKGMIFFDPDPAKGGAGPQGAAVISDGKYSTALDGQGVRPGPYLVRINAFDGKVTPDLPMGNGLCPEFLDAKEFPPADSTYDVEVGKPAGKKR